jgi:hypothetical protein
MTQGRAILAGCAELLSQIGIPDVQQLQKHGALDIILADLKGIRMMVLGRREHRTRLAAIWRALSACRKSR